MSASDATSPPASKILVVDDNEANRFLAKETLEVEGHTAILAATGLEGIAAFQRELPDCVLLDVRMPDLDGFAVCDRLRALPGGKETPIIFVTGLRDVDTFDRALAAGADDFLAKPAPPAELVVRVHTLLRLRHMRSTLRAQYELFKQQRDALVRVQLERERVLSFVVHDLKSPVNTIDLHAQALLRERPLPVVVHEAARQIRAAGRHLNRMILNLLDVAKAEQGQLAPARAIVELAPLAASVIDELQIAAAERRVTLRSRLDAPAAHADADLLRRVLENLVDNAIRHSPVGGVVEIASRRVSGGVEVRVADEGAGVPAALREQVFEAFAQADGRDPSSRDHRGLGLAFCKQAVEAHGGRIGVADGGPGAVFSIFIPDADA